MQSRIYRNYTEITDGREHSVLKKLENKVQVYLANRKM
jgi:hypothetical protein